jgi:hypothetical protein
MQCMRKGAARLLEQLREGGCVDKLVWPEHDIEEPLAQLRDASLAIGGVPLWPSQLFPQSQTCDREDGQTHRAALVRLQLSNQHAKALFERVLTFSPAGPRRGIVTQSLWRQVLPRFKHVEPCLSEV